MRTALKVHLLVVDPQIDFMGDDSGNPFTETLDSGVVRKASLPVPGAIADMDRFAALVDRLSPRLSDIHVTLDTHRTMHIAHPEFWLDANGQHPTPLITMISADDVRNDIWRPRRRRDYVISYLEALEADGKFPHMIWPPHCRIGDWGHAVYPPLHAALTRWERDRFGCVNYVTKGSSLWTEHFGALMAQVQDPTDPSTQLNTGLIQLIQEADIIGVGGEALSHCDKTTIEQIADNIGDEHLRKMHLFTDCMSPVAAVPGADFPEIGRQFLKDMEARGMTLTTSDQFLA
jgi:nicotinamidase-related amidase